MFSFMKSNETFITGGAVIEISPYNSKGLVIKMATQYWWIIPVGICRLHH